MIQKDIEDKFEKTLREFNFDEGIIIPVYWCVDEDNKIFIDVESMEEEFNIKLKEINDLKNENI